MSLSSTETGVNLEVHEEFLSLQFVCRGFLFYQDLRSEKMMCIGENVTEHLGVDQSAGVVLQYPITLCVALS